MALKEFQNGGVKKAVVELSFKALKPQLFVEAPKATNPVQLYKVAFDYVETCRTTQPKHRAEQELPHIIFAQLKLAGFTILVSNLSDDFALAKAEGTRFAMCLEIEDVKAAVAAKVMVKDEIEQGWMQIAMFDWHNFVVVETIDFADEEKEDCPPPMTLEEVIRRGKISVMDEVNILRLKRSGCSFGFKIMGQEFGLTFNELWIVLLKIRS